MWGRARWIRTPVVDLGLAMAWVPFAVAAHAVRDDPSALATLLSATFLLSFFHQPLTLPLVYGDPDQFARRRRIFTWSPVVFVVVIVVGLSISLSLVAIVAGLWNAEHTLMQRFGLTRIYGRKAGEEDGSLERWMLVSWLVLAVVWIGADPATPGRVARLPLGEVNIESVDRLTALQPFAAALVAPVVIVAVVLAVRWVAIERGRASRGEANPAKWLYVGLTAALFAWMLVDPVAGFVAYVGSHSIEYLVIVHHALGARYADGSGGVLGAVTRRRAGRGWFFATYVAAIALLVGALTRAANPDAYGFVILLLGGLHVFYDGFIWKLRRPDVARGLVAPGAQPMPANVSA